MSAEESKCVHCTCHIEDDVPPPTKCTPFNFFKEFAVSSTLHGLKYIGEKRSFVERLFWTAVFLISIGMCSRQIYKVYDKWNISPVIVSFSEQSMPVFKVPFPAVTICPQVKTSDTYNYSADFDKVMETDDYINLTYLKYILDVSLICRLDFPLNLVHLTRNETGNENIGDIEIIKAIEDVTPKMSEVFRKCKWRGNDEDCDNLFFPVYTNEGVCYTFNSLSQDEIFKSESIQNNYSYTATTHNSNYWSINEGYNISEWTKPNETYPKIGRENSVYPDLQLILSERAMSEDPHCNRLFSGFKVYMHHPADLPRASLYYYSIIPKHETSLAVKFNMVTTANSLASYSPKLRQCYFEKDKQLRYFKIYSQVNCELECEANYTFQMCKCVWYNMPHEDSNNICRLGKLDCVLSALETLTRIEMLASLEAENNNYERDACRCLPACNSTTYDAEVLKTDIFLDNYADDREMQNIFNDLVNMLDIPNMTINIQTEYSSLSVYFKEARFPSIQRLELFGMTDFLAQCGGLLGLFLGFSFISLVEIFFFPLTRALRWWNELPIENEHKSKRNDLKLA